jgi:hypothetical protein
MPLEELIFFNLQAVKSRDEVPPPWGGTEEDMYNVLSGSGSWIEENVFS